ncbi:Cys-tRNA(Pro) deacylase [Marinobacter sp. X15-166B]|uniref:Cys-tRNA(Pro) deacylase n=1 Tax=Marinobacter sp. X15-166B TaxID=1897620 RepID=UPI00085CC02D|nr:Cys-tRNA(Pro) deacylase [Marinobacter sp. X15-166B]OEY66183.1 aminoacyl-tRNA deacylase [Marinobacter sp. X15-166B]
MTPAILAARKAGIDHQVHAYEHDPSCASFGLEAVEKMGVDPARVFKTLIVAVDSKELVVAVLPVGAHLSMKLIAKAAGGKKAAMADKAAAQRATGYLLGGVSPLGQKKRLRTFIDASAEALASVYVSAGQRGLEIELAPADLQRLTSATWAALQQN